MSEKNVNDYRVVQTGPATWAILYSNGEFYGGFSNQGLAQEQARQNIDSAAGNSPDLPLTDPRSISEASQLADDARMSYRSFLALYPNATSDARAPYEQQIAKYDAYVNDFAGKQALARLQSVDGADQVQIEQNQNLSTADAQRKLLATQAVQVRTTGASADAIATADAQAFASERYYQSLLAQQNSATAQQVSVAATTVDPNNSAYTFGVANSQVMQTPSVGQTVLNVGDNVDVSRPTSFDFGVGSFLTDYSSLANTANNYLNSSLNQLTSTAGTGLSTAGLGNVAGDLQSAINGGTNLTNTGSATATSSGSEMRVRVLAKDAWKSKLTTGLLGPLKDIGGVIFPYTPTITYQGSANYNTITTVHANQDWHIYQNTPSLQIVINGAFTAQNDQEAQYLLASIHFFRTATKMHFGDNDQNKGLPPPQMWLYGYGSHMFNQLSVIINSYNVDMPNNVDYLDVTVDGVTSRVPVLTNITITCTVQNTPKKSREFDWDKFASGELLKAGRWI